MVNELTLTRGDTVTYRITVINNGEAFDVSGYTSKFTVKEKKTDINDNAIIGPITGSVVVGADGTIDFALDEDDTSVDEGTYYYDVEITDGAEVHTVVNSILRVTLDVTK